MARVINWLERLTKIDLDGDGDIGIMGTEKSREAERIEVAKKAAKHIESQIEEMDVQQDFLQKQLMDLDKNIKAKMQKNDEAGALDLMKKKKLLKKEVDTINGKKANLFQQKLMLEGGVKDRNLVVAMKAGKDALGELQDGMQKTELTGMMVGIQGQADAHDQIDNILGQRVGMEEFEEDALLEELRAMKI